MRRPIFLRRTTRATFTVFAAVVAFAAPLAAADAQVRQVPVGENFDSVVAPALPAGWLTTANHSVSGDFTTTVSLPRSDSNAVLSTDAAAAQSLTSPVLDFSGMEADSLLFFERRSASHNSGVIVEASTDGGATFGTIVGDTLKNPGVTTYVPRQLRLPAALSDQSSVRIRWRVVGNGTGTSGTVRFDDIRVSAKGQVDAAVTGLNFFPALPRAGDSVLVAATIRNAGTSALHDIPVDFYVDADGDSLPEREELFGTSTVNQAIGPNDTVAVGTMLRNLRAGTVNVIAVARAAGDQNPRNDVARRRFAVAAAPASVIINEIMYDPVPGGSEYVELMNRSPLPVDLLGWSVTDARGPGSGSTVHLIARSQLLLGPGEYLVVATDSSLFGRFAYLTRPPYRAVIRSGAFSLNNSGDDVIVADLTKTTVDSVRYLPGWQNQELDDPSGRSLERINPSLPGNDGRNWSTCADPLGGTPGKRNSLYTSAPRSGASVSFSPNPFSPDGDGIEDVTIMRYRIPAAAAVIRVRIFDSLGRLVRTLADGEPAGSEGDLVWDGFDDDRRKVRMGIYVVLLEARGSDGESTESVKTTVVVAAKL